MRPRKNILLYCTDECERSWITFFIENTGKFRVVGGVSGSNPDAILVVDDRSLGTVTTARGIASLLPSVPLLLLLQGQYRHPAHGYPCWATILPTGAKPAEILNAVHLATIRKRGPRGLRSDGIHVVASA